MVPLTTPTPTPTAVHLFKVISLRNGPAARQKCSPIHTVTTPKNQGEEKVSEHSPPDYRNSNDPYVAAGGFGRVGATRWIGARTITARPHGVRSVLIR